MAAASFACAMSAATLAATINRWLARGPISGPPIGPAEIVFRLIWRYANQAVPREHPTTGGGSLGAAPNWHANFPNGRAAHLGAYFEQRDGDSSDGRQGHLLPAWARLSEELERPNLCR